MYGLFHEKEWLKTIFAVYFSNMHGIDLAKITLFYNVDQIFYLHSWKRFINITYYCICYIDINYWTNMNDKLIHITCYKSSIHI